VESASINAAKSQPPLLAVRDLHVHFPIRGGILQRVMGEVRAVDGVSLEIARGETLGLVGESGCGKTTVGRAVLRLIAATSGSVLFEGTDVLGAAREGLRLLRRKMQIVFQDPGSSLNPRLTIERAIGEPLWVHGLVASREDLRTRVEELLIRCGMPREAADKYPHEFSGGQRQRLGIARALALSPKLVVCDEPTSALDVSIQAQIINLLMDLRREFGLSLLFISHDMGVIQHVSQRLAVMNAGKIVETGDRDSILMSPQDPYTRRLLAAVPVPVPRRARVPHA
jgi:ABC-type oligopeptide transport system ATPase subunit